jgi:FlaA1/EpsC-like NDP-sugar epimerase
MSRTVIFRFTQVIIDLLVLSGALWLGVLIRFDGAIPVQMLKRALFLWPYIVSFQYLLLVALGIPRFSWRYIGLREAVRILAALLISSGVLALARIGTVQFLPVGGYAQYLFLPLGIVALDLLLSFVGLSGVRVVRRMSTERAERLRRNTPIMESVPTLLVGAGRSGLMIAKELERRPELGIRAVGFIDDDRQTHGTLVHGVRVLGGVDRIKDIAASCDAKQAVITISSAPGNTVRNIAQACRRAGLKTKVIPGLYQIVGGDLNLNRIRDVAIEDLLRREPVVLDDQAIATELRGRVVLITGAGGSIGSEICRQVAGIGPKVLILVERAENALFEIHRELHATFRGITLVPCIADLCDGERMEQVFSEHAPEVVFHAAAHKHVPMMEWNPGEAIKNNVFGTRRLGDMADAHGVRAFVMISTDKAVNPTSIMGATKRAAEIYIQALAGRSRTRFVTVRFGNVLGSNGSVVPIFKEQIARGGPVTITHPDMKRYFMTIPEACQLVLQAGTMGRGGEIFILDMGQPVKIVDLARDLIQLSGFDADEVDIVFTGVRPGEKLYEELSIAEEHAVKTRHPKVFIGRTTTAAYEDISARLADLAAALKAAKRADEIPRFLARIVPEYGLRLGLTERPAARIEAAEGSTTPASSLPGQLAEA